MALEMNARKAFDSVVGAENVSEDPAVLLGYAFGFGNFGMETTKMLPFQPEAVVLPGSTEEVQGVVKVCGRYGLRFKAHCTGWGAFGMPGMEGVVMVDLRRMDRIIDIDEKNMFAVIEPYVIAGQLQAEAMKRGLNCHIVGAGPSHSPLASATSMMGIGTTGMTTGSNQRNLFGVEWVLPTGEVLRLGSPGCGAGWFSGDGPGPSLRGIMRGFTGAMGGLGIFTKIGYKLYPWPGPDKPKRTGEHPQIGLKVPENFKYCYPYWECWEDVMKATYKIHESGVAYIVNRVPPDWAGWMLTKTNNEFHELFEMEALPILRNHKMGFNTIIAARSGHEFEYKNKVLKQIVKGTKGKFLDFTAEQEAMLFGVHIQSAYVARGFRPTSEFGTSFGQCESVGIMKKVVEVGEKCMEDHVKPGGKFVAFGSEGFWGWSIEGRSWWDENAYSFDHRDPEAKNASMQYFMKAAEAVNEGGLGTNLMVYGPLIDMYGPRLSHVELWLRKIKNTFDPKSSADHSAYVSPEPAAPPQIPA